MEFTSSHGNDMVYLESVPYFRTRLKQMLEDQRCQETLLPTTCGGQQSLKQATDNFRDMFEKQTKWFKLEEQFLMDLSIPAPGSSGSSARTAHRNEFPGEESMVGSFRKLTVDWARPPPEGTRVFELPIRFRSIPENQMVVIGARYGEESTTKE